MKKRILPYACIFLFFVSPVLAQRQTVFQYGTDPSQRLVAFSKAACGGFCWQAQDFGLSTVNPNEYSEIGFDPQGRTLVTGYLWIQTTLIADDPNFLYKSGCANPDMSGRCVGTYQNMPWLARPYTPTEPNTGFISNIITAFIPLPGMDPGVDSVDWRGQVKIESIQQVLSFDPTRVAVVQSFYSWDPAQFTTPVGQTSDFADPCLKIKAWQIAWQAIDRFVPVYWDGSFSNGGKLVILYTNLWHNHPCWTRGWQTTITLINNSVDKQPRTYTLENGWDFAMM